MSLLVTLGSFLGLDAVQVQVSQGLMGIARQVS